VFIKTTHGKIFINISIKEIVKKKKNQNCNPQNCLVSLRKCHSKETLWVNEEQYPPQAPEAEKEYVVHCNTKKYLKNLAIVHQL
jgi:hypothetical protein